MHPVLGANLLVLLCMTFAAAVMIVQTGLLWF